MKTRMRPVPSSRLSSVLSWSTPILWLLSYFGVRALLEGADFSPAWRVAVSLLPVLPAAAFIGLAIAGIHSMDELEQRIHLEALAVAFPLAILLLMTLGLVELAVPLSPQDWSYRHVWPLLPLFYFLGLVVARRRYQ